MRWKKLGRIFEPPSHLDWMVGYAAVPVALHLAGARYRIYFSGRDGENRSQLGYFEIDLDDPARTLKVSQRAVLGHGEPGRFDDSGVMGSSLVRSRDGRLLLYYIGWNRGTTVPFYNSIGLAASDDGGESFRRVSIAPVVPKDELDPCFTAGPHVMIEGPLWRLWYLSCVRWVKTAVGMKHYYNIRYAESDDGLCWRKHPAPVIDFAGPQEYAISQPRVLRDGEAYKMWYSYRGHSYRIGYATSGDGVHWQRRDSEVGIDVSSEGWDCESIEYPCLFDHGGKRYLFYNGNSYGQTGVGLAVLEAD
jgi:predicted GH43/DUF377 family glycosyl hydrolase